MQIAINELEIELAAPEDEAADERDERQGPKAPPAPARSPTREQLRAWRRHEERLIRVRAG